MKRISFTETNEKRDEKNQIYEKDSFEEDKPLKTMRKSRTKHKNKKSSNEVESFPKIIEKNEEQLPQKRKKRTEKDLQNIKKIKKTETPEQIEVSEQIEEFEQLEESEQSEEMIYLEPKYTETLQFDFEKADNKQIYAIPKNRPVRLYSDGVYDMFHYGHMRCLMQAKNLFPNVHLIVGVTSDAMTLLYKGNLIMDEKERYESVKHCRYVDEVIEDAPWAITDEFLEKYKIDYVCHDDLPYSAKGSSDIYKFLKDKNMFIPTRRTVGISTTDIVTKIVRDYDLFVRRQLERGIDLEELNLPFFKKESIIMQNRLKALENDFKNEIRDIKTELKSAFFYWERVSNELIDKFNERFTRNIKNNNPFNKFIRKILLIVAKKKIEEEIK